MRMFAVLCHGRNLENRCTINRFQRDTAAVRIRVYYDIIYAPYGKCSDLALNVKSSARTQLMALPYDHPTAFRAPRPRLMNSVQHHGTQSFTFSVLFMVYFLVKASATVSINSPRGSFSHFGL